ncbi:hypothetical protein KUCAC02_023596, partial [Chaenocephalus aceratus]
AFQTEPVAGNPLKAPLNIAGVWRRDTRCDLKKVERNELEKTRGDSGRESEENKELTDYHGWCLTSEQTPTCRAQRLSVSQRYSSVPRP